MPNGTQNGGAIWTNCAVSSTAARFEGNTASMSGGALSCSTDSATVQADIAPSNVAPKGSALSVDFGSLVLYAGSLVNGSIYVGGDVTLAIQGKLVASSSNNASCLELADNSTLTVAANGELALTGACSISGKGSVFIHTSGVFAISGGKASLQVPAVMSANSIFQVALRSKTDFDALSVVSPGGSLLLQPGALVRVNSEGNYKPSKGHSFEVVTAQSATFDLVIGRFANHLKPASLPYFSYSIKYNNHTASSKSNAYQAVVIHIRNGGLSGGQIAGIVIGSVFGFVLIVVAGYFIVSKFVLKKA